MSSEERRLRIIDILSNLNKPISGTSLAEKMNVSRQIIVQDIAILRAENKNIISTNKGYMLYKSSNLTYREAVAVNHGRERILEEFYAIVDNGGTILNVSINHDLYGHIDADLFISNRADAKYFAARMEVCHNSPLSALTGDLHCHLIETKDRETMQLIKDELKQLGLLAERAI